MNVRKTDVLVIGTGAAGSMAAIKASDYTKEVTVLEKAAHRSGGAVEAVKVKIPIAFW